MEVINSVADLREIARRRVPRALFDYVDRGSYDEHTLERNTRDLAALAIRQRVMVDVSKLSVGTTVLGEHWSMPVAIAPTGLTGLFHAWGEVKGARAAQAVGVPFCLSTMSICSIEDVRAAVEGPFWFQLYVMRDRAFTESLIARAREARCSALVLTLDLAVPAVRRRDAKNGLGVPPRLTLANAFDLLRRPRWVASVLLGRRRTLGNLEGWIEKRGVSALTEWVATQFDASVSWQDVAWVRERWPGKLILKGILDAEDARRAVDCGADALVVSNHGGRQLDGAPSTIAALPQVVDAIAGRIDVLFDGGVTSGQDVFKALALGARGCLIGKSFLYGLAARGGDGVALTLALLRRELEVTMALAGKTDVREISRDALFV
jgi:L-lactate dehydrogenase (cytochrome)